MIMITKQLTRTLILCIGYALSLIALSSLLSPQASAYIFSESGPFEILSFVLWFVLAISVLLFMRPRNWTTISLAFLATVAGLRELGVNKALTSESITRISYYLNADIFWLERLSVAGFIVFLGATSTILLVKFGRWLFQSNGLEHPAGQIALLALLLAPVTKILDRLPAYLSGFLDAELLLAIAGTRKALEEGLEMLLPILFLQALFLLSKTLQGRQKVEAGLYRV